MQILFTNNCIITKSVCTLQQNVLTMSWVAKRMTVSPSYHNTNKTKL